jgi:hypothetical protein
MRNLPDRWVCTSWNPGRGNDAHGMDEIGCHRFDLDSQENRVSNGVQRYPCSEAYCLRKNKNTGNVYCRFHFLYSLQDEPVIAKPPFSSFYRLYLALNCYNKAADQHGLAGQYRHVTSTPVS